MTLLYPILTLLVAVLFMMGGTGALTTIISLRLDAVGTPSILLGAVTAAYYTGLMLGSMQAYRLIGRVGHIRAFSASAAAMAAATLGHAFGTDPLVWIGLRFVEGCCMAGLLVCIESWLNQSAAPGTRGQILALYMIVLYAAQGIGQYLLVLPDPEGFRQFAVVSMLVSLAVLPVALTRRVPLLPPEISPLPIRSLYGISPLGIAGILMSGLVIGAFYGLSPVYVRHLGYDLGESATFMSFAIIGGMLLQWPLGKLSDLFDRRVVLIGLFAALTAISVAMIALPALGFPILLGGAALFGGIMFALYPVCVSHTNDFLTPDEMVPASGGMVLSFAIGAIVGPFLASLMMTVFEDNGLFVFAAAVGALALAFGLWRMTVRPTVPADRRLPFLAQPPTPSSALLTTVDMAVETANAQESGEGDGAGAAADPLRS